MDRLLVADAIGRTPSSSEFKRLLSSSRAYGLTIGTEKADHIAPTDLGLKIVKPAHAEEALKAKVLACLTVELLAKVWRQFNRQKLPDAKFLKEHAGAQLRPFHGVRGRICGSDRRKREILRHPAGDLRL
jgi:hypothetical protein